MNHTKVMWKLCGSNTSKHVDNHSYNLKERKREGERKNWLETNSCITYEIGIIKMNKKLGKKRDSPQIRWQIIHTMGCLP